MFDISQSILVDVMRACHVHNYGTTGVLMLCTKVCTNVLRQFNEENIKFQVCGSRNHACQQSRATLPIDIRPRWIPRAITSSFVSPLICLFTVH